ncbi:ABC transporter permease [bacterium]|nr:ABC transporter permease [Akkermansiaceae bacterium]MDB4587885.1 ABC transporter permease [bacterium]MDB4725236.1 ABC transporter permease [Akkermansiaceae bacterium]
MKAFFTLLLDSFRMLKSGAIFWVTFGISILVALIYLAIGFDENGLTFLGMGFFESEDLVKGSAGAESFYTEIFSFFIVGFWLSWAAIILALISCASTFPKVMEEGSAGMLLTKKSSRLGVFVAKYIGSLLFMLVQVGLFVVIVLIAMKWRLGFWNLSLFWFLPATLLVFSFLYSFLVLVAVKTRSTLTAILLTMGLWGLTWVVNFTEAQLFRLSRLAELSEEFQDSDAQGIPSSMRSWHDNAKIAYAIFPKTTPTIDAARNALTVNQEPEAETYEIPEGMSEEQQEFVEFMEKSEKVEEDMAERHSLAYILGTSLTFEAIMLSLAAWIFCRRDF